MLAKVHNSDVVIENSCLVTEERNMADLKESEASQAAADLSKTPEIQKGEPKPKMATRQQRRVARNKSTGPDELASSAVASATPRTARKRYSEKERVQKLGEIEKQTSQGESIKTAINKAGISEQTYYQWKRAAAQASQNDELEDLVKLEQENARLKKLLADRLRTENAELRKKLGLG